jgi:4-hydroxy-4-methyl-2-oxoglutarate aldolase
MIPEPAVSAPEIEALRRLDTCTVSDAIETFELRLRNTGFADASIRCMSEALPPMVGYAATARLRSVDPPITGRIYHERSDLWQSILKIPAPRVVVIEDVDTPAGRGAFLGNMHAAIFAALGCVGFVTNGAVRNLPEVNQLGLHLFAGNVAVSHAYSHIFDFGGAVTVGGLEVKPGALLHGDSHGLLTVPKQIVRDIPAVAARLEESEKKIVEFSRSKEFSIEELRQKMNELF